MTKRIRHLELQRRMRFSVWRTKEEDIWRRRLVEIHRDRSELVISYIPAEIKWTTSCVGNICLPMFEMWEIINIINTEICRGYFFFWWVNNPSKYIISHSVEWKFMSVKLPNKKRKVAILVETLNQDGVNCNGNPNVAHAAGLIRNSEGNWHGCRSIACICWGSIGWLFTQITTLGHLPAASP